MEHSKRIEKLKRVLEDKKAKLSKHEDIVSKLENEIEALEKVIDGYEDLERL